MNNELSNYTNEELIKQLNSKNELDSYNLLNIVYKENEVSNKYYCLFDDFLKMVDGKTSFTRMRGVGLCLSLAKWDVENKIDKNFDSFLNLLYDPKPTTVRITISSLETLILYKPALKSKILPALDKIDLTKYKDTMAPLIKKDVERIKVSLK